MKYIMLEKQGSGHYTLHDDNGHKMTYLYDSKRDAIRAFKRTFGYRYKHNVVVVEI